MVRPTSWVPLAVLALLVGLTVWLNQLVQAPSERGDGSKRHDPDLIVENFSARKLGEDGRVLYTLVARKMVHYPDDDTSRLEWMTFEAFEPHQPKVTITADHGRLEQRGERVWVEGNVVVLREGGEGSEPARLTTDRLLVLPDEGIARTAAGVVLESPSGRAEARGLELNNRTRTVRLDRVQATYKKPR